MKYLLMMMLISVSTVSAGEVQTDCHAMNQEREKITKTSGAKKSGKAAATKQ